MMITVELILQAFLFAFLGGAIFSVIGVIPGTDETATMAPLTLVLVLLGVQPVVLFAWFIGITVAMQITHTIPTAMTALPGSTMAVPMIQYCRTAKALGVPHIIMRKMAAGSLIGSLIAVPVAVGFAVLLAPLGEMLKPYIGLIFTLGAIFIAYMSKAKWGAVIGLVPYAFLIQGIQRLAQEGVGKSLFISIFMGITIGPMIAEIFNVFVPEIRQTQKTGEVSKVYLAPDPAQKIGIFPNPFRQFPAEQGGKITAASAISACTFTFSPVGMTVLLGELLAGKNKEVYQKTMLTAGIQDAVTNATYIGELIIPLLAFGLPLSPVALGPAAPLFQAPPVFTTDPVMNLHSFLGWGDYLLYGLIGIIGGAAFAYPLAMNKARSWTEKMLRYVSHEALIGSFLGLVFMLAFYEAGGMGIVITLSVALFSGILSNRFGMHTGVLFMGFYASSFITGLFL